MNLAQRIAEIKVSVSELNLGYIDSEFITLENGKRVKRYWLVKW